MPFYTQAAITTEISSAERSVFPATSDPMIGLSRLLTVADLYSPLPLAHEGVLALVPVSDSAVLQVDNPGKPTNALEAPKQLFPTASEVPTPSVRPCVQEFIKRVIVPILVKRFIEQQNRDKLSAHRAEVF